MKNCTIIIMGITGDLARKKLIPAYYSLRSRYPDSKFRLIGCAKEESDIHTILNNAKPYINNFNPELFSLLEKEAFYYKLDFNNISDFQNLALKLEDFQKQEDIGNNKLIYLACPADFFVPITKNLALSSIVQNKSKLPPEIFNLIVYEKPFGWDLTSAYEINQVISNYFEQEQIFRIDHYLTKSLVNSIALVRFTNSIFEPVWNKNYIQQIQIIFDESISIGPRGLFYDKYGALKDVVQNHMLQLLSLVAMAKPYPFKPEQISKAKAQVLQYVSVQDGILGQYQGYKSESGVNPSSITETFAYIKLMINNTQWSGVPFYLKTGKNLKSKSTEIKIVFKPISIDYFKEFGEFEPNVLNIIIAPDSSFSLKLNTQKAGDLYRTIPVTMNFCYHCEFGQNFREAYELLLSEILKLDHSISVSKEEIENSWKIIDKIKELKFPLYSYDKGTSGPKEQENFIKKHNLYLNKVDNR